MRIGLAGRLLIDHSVAASGSTRSLQGEGPRTV